MCVSELRKEDGSEYTPRSLAQFIASLQRYINDKKEGSIRLCNPDNPTFKQLHRTLDSRYRQLHAQGIGAKRRHAEVLTNEEEDQLWDSGTLSTESPSGLLRAVFFYNGLNFVLRGGQEHRNLKISQLKFSSVPDPDRPGVFVDCVEYTEHGSKNRPGGCHQLNLENKVVIQYARPELGVRCHVYLLQLYLSKLPQSAFEQDIFYMKAKKTIPDSLGEPWYAETPVGHNMLDKFLKTMLIDANVNAEKRSNHNLRATAISRMYEKNVPEKLIMERSGHLSREGVNSYEHTTSAQQKAVCSTLSTGPSYGHPPTLPIPSPHFVEDPFKMPLDLIDFVLDENQAADNFKENPCITPPLPDKKDDGALDIMKKLQFNNMTNCTLNINFKT